jgi:hypothetical protein
VVHVQRWSRRVYTRFLNQATRADHPARSQVTDAEEPRPANEVTFWEDVKAGLWVWLVIVGVAIAVLCHYANWSALDL